MTNATKIFTVPMLGDTAELEEMNAFLRGHKILSVTEAPVVISGSSWWSYSVRYLSTTTARPGGSRKKVDYREVLGADTFNYFATLRDRRKAIAKREGVPAYVVFTDVELAEIAKKGPGADLPALLAISGVGQRKLAQYGPQILKDEASK
jgi:superfamily II DNA helicase RecQ